MSKIVLFDPYLPKFTQDMQEWWIRNGHEVKAERYYNPSLIDWADVIWFETVDNNILSATNPSQALLDDTNNYQPWKLTDHDLTGKRVICRMIDIEVWQQHYMGVDWTGIDDVIFIAPHIRQLVDPSHLQNGSHLRFHTIPCGLDLDKWTFKQRKPGFDIAVVSERWTSKGVAEILQVAYRLKQIDERYKIHWLGQLSDHAWEHAYRDDFVQHHKLNVEFTNILLDGETVNEWLEDKNYLLHGSHKEGFSYATAEAMAKGIKPVLHRFYGADDLWPGMTWNGIEEAVQMITSKDYDSKAYRQYLIDRGYDIGSVMERFMDVIRS